MTTGLRCWDESGNLILDFTDRISKVVASGFVTFSDYGQSINIAISGMTTSDEWSVSIPNGHYAIPNNGYFTARSSTSFAEPGVAVPYTVIRK